MEFLNDVTISISAKIFVILMYIGFFVWVAERIMYHQNVKFSTFLSKITELSKTVGVFLLAVLFIILELAFFILGCVYWQWYLPFLAIPYFLNKPINPFAFCTMCISYWCEKNKNKKLEDDYLRANKYYPYDGEWNER